MFNIKTSNQTIIVRQINSNLAQKYKDIIVKVTSKQSGSIVKVYVIKYGNLLNVHFQSINKYLEFQPSLFMASKSENFIS